MDWPKWYQDSYNLAQKNLDEMARKSLLDDAFFRASAYAKRAAKNNGFYPRPGDDGEPIYTAQQGRMAACHTREEVAAILVLQKTIIRGLTALIVIGMACLGILLYLANQANS